MLRLDVFDQLHTSRPFASRLVGRSNMEDLMKSFSGWKRAIIMSGVVSASCLSIYADDTISNTTMYAIWSLTNCAENSQTDFAYNYAENIGDGRGITFGIVGFTSGTYDGTILLQRIRQLDPENPLVKYLPAFLAIDASPHDQEGKTDNIAGLDNFIADFTDHGNDPKVKEAQLGKLLELYWNPAVAGAQEIGAKLAITVGELYDICVNHGADSDQHAKGLKQLVDETNKAMGGTPKSGVDETKWLRKLFEIRLQYMNSDPSWAGALDRVEMYRRILTTGNVNLKVPFNVTCYGDSFTITGERP